MRLLRSRYAGLILFALFFLTAGFVLRVALLVQAFSEADARPLALAWAFAFGLFCDGLVCLWFLLPLTLVVLGRDRFLSGWFGRTLSLSLFSLGVFLALFSAAVEWCFWNEFTGSRFNLIAVDYLHLKMLREVLTDVWQSYPVVPIVLGLLVLSALIVLPAARTVLRSCREPLPRSRWLWSWAGYLVGLSLALPFAFSVTLSNTSENWTNKNLAKNGLLSLFTSLCNRDVTYDENLYVTRDQRAVTTRLRTLLKTANSQYVSANSNDITRKIDNGPTPDKHNVMLVVVESLSAEYLGVFGNKQGLTPNLDELAGQSILFTRLYACGTRTIRGLEALNLSLPPTPGRAIGKRPDANRLFSAERIFRALGYRTLFFYGGRGTFDNVDEFLCQGGFELIDQRKFKPDEVHFTNAWGICDGDTYRRVIREADATHQSGRKFFVTIMTLSNHVPYTYPQEIDIPSRTGITGSVKYTDFALGRFLREAREKPWFDDTIFVITADHCYRRRAVSDSSPIKYHIPAFIYAPKLVQPQRVESLTSQIDILPTVLGIMNASYETKFFGRDVLREPPDRAFVGTELDLGLIVGRHKVVLSPGRVDRTFNLEPDGSETPIQSDPDEVDRAITYYQGAGYLLQQHLYNAK